MSVGAAGLRTEVEGRVQILAWIPRPLLSFEGPGKNAKGRAWLTIA